MRPKLDVTPWLSRARPLEPEIPTWVLLAKSLEHGSGSGALTQVLGLSGEAWRAGSPQGGRTTLPRGRGSLEHRCGGTCVRGAEAAQRGVGARSGSGGWR